MAEFTIYDYFLDDRTIRRFVKLSKGYPKSLKPKEYCCDENCPSSELEEKVIESTKPAVKAVSYQIKKVKYAQHKNL